jgi:hypothetical protein
VGSPPLNHYQVRLHGENFSLQIDGAVQDGGFYTTRWVQAVDAEAAGLIAVDLLRKDPTLTASVRNPRDDSPMIYVEEVYLLSDFDGINAPGGGFTFYFGAESDEPIWRRRPWVTGTLIVVLLLAVLLGGHRVYSNLHQREWWADDRGQMYEGPAPAPGDELRPRVPSIAVDWQRGPKPIYFHPYISERSMAPIDGIEMHMIGDRLTIEDRSYGPVHAGDVVKVTEDAVSINGVRVDPIR